MSAPRTKPPSKEYSAGWDAVFGGPHPRRRSRKGVAVRSVNRRLVEKDGRTVRPVVREKHPLEDM